MRRTFGRKTVAPGPVQEEHPALRAVANAAQDLRREDPLAAARMGAKELFHRVYHMMKDDRGVHIESLLAVLGSLGGFACIAALMQMLDETGETLDSVGVLVVEGKDGSRYFFGDAPNHSLLESRLSIWSLTAGMAEHLGASYLPDPSPILRHVAASVGSAEYGIPRWPESHKAGDLPINYVTHLWPALKPLVDQFCARPSEWPILFGLAIQEAMQIGKDALDPVIAATIVIECAAPMAKIDPSRISGR